MIEKHSDDNLERLRRLVKEKIESINNDAVRRNVYSSGIPIKSKMTVVADLIEKEIPVILARYPSNKMRHDLKNFIEEYAASLYANAVKNHGYKEGSRDADFDRRIIYLKSFTDTEYKRILKEKSSKNVPVLLTILGSVIAAATLYIALLPYL
jgi:hypothetical protein